MEGGIGIMRGGTVLANGNCRCPGFQNHGTNFESERFNSSQEGHNQENVRNAIMEDEIVGMMRVEWVTITTDSWTVFYVSGLRTSGRQHCG